MADFLPRREVDLLAWSVTFRNRLLEGSQAYGISPELAAEYALLHEAFDGAYRVANAGATNSSSSYQVKAAARDELKRAARRIAGIVRATPSVENAQRSALGLTVPAGRRGRINRPESAPYVFIAAVAGRKVTVRLVDTESSTRRGKPRDVSAAAVFCAVGDRAPNDVSGWTFAGNYTRTTIDLTFGSQVPSGSTIWVCAAWLSPRAERGPTSVAVSADIAGPWAFAPGAMRPTLWAA